MCFARPSPSGPPASRCTDSYTAIRRRLRDAHDPLWFVEPCARPVSAVKLYRPCSRPLADLHGARPASPLPIPFLQHAFPHLTVGCGRCAHCVGNANCPHALRRQGLASCPQGVEEAQPCPWRKDHSTADWSQAGSLSGTRPPSLRDFGP